MSPKIRDTILLKSIEVLSEQGLDGFSLKDISVLAEVTPAAVYYYFHDKKTLVEETLDRYLLPIIRGYWDIMDSNEDPAEMIKALLKAILWTTRESPWFLPLWSREIANDRQPMREYLTQRARLSALENFVRKIKKGQEEGVINPDLIPEILYVSMFSTIYIIILARKSWELIFGREVDQDSLEKHIVAFTLEGILTPRK
jgi:AcrR family transcriptional regulator